MITTTNYDLRDAPASIDRVLVARIIATRAARGRRA